MKKRKNFLPTKQHVTTKVSIFCANWRERQFNKQVGILFLESKKFNFFEKVTNSSKMKDSGFFTHKYQKAKCLFLQRMPGRKKNLHWL